MKTQARQPELRARSRRIGPAWLALVALLIQWAAPALHGLDIAHERQTCAAEASAAPESCAPSERPTPTHHDEADCKVCLAIAQARDGLTPTLVLCIIETAPVRWAEPLATARAAPALLGSDAFPRGPPALIAA